MREENAEHSLLQQQQTAMAEEDSGVVEIPIFGDHIDLKNKNKRNDMRDTFLVINSERSDQV